MTYGLLFLIGLSFGSFVNALVWRLRELEHVRSKAKRKALSPLTGRSMCTHCSHELSAFDLVPVFSWLLLGGKCRYCRKSIGWQYPFVELLTASLFVLFFVYWPYQLTGLSWIAFAVWLLLATNMIALLVYDQKWLELPDKLVISASLLAVAFSGALFADGDVSAHYLLKAISGGAVLFALFYVLFQVSKGAWIGGGDVKLAPALGLLAGSALNALLLLFIASLLGTIIAIPSLVKGKSKKSIKLPFGPLLIFGLFVVILFGRELTSWYASQFLYL